MSAVVYDCDGSCGPSRVFDPATPVSFNIGGGVATLTLGESGADDANGVVVDITSAPRKGTYTATITAQVALR
jgi:hypothetical protein